MQLGSALQAAGSARANQGNSKHHLHEEHSGKDLLFARLQRQRMNFVAVMQCLFVPWILFCITFGVMSFYIHYSKPWLCWALVGIPILIVLWMGANAWKTFQAKMKQEETRDPNWFVFLFITSLIGVGLGLVLGNQVFWTFMQRYYDYANLNDYNFVDVAQMKGQQLMDGGRINFVEGTTLDLRKAIGFQNSQTYCVAPLTFKTKPGVPFELASYDFWAVGLNCCSGDNKDFHCGDFNNAKAHGGLRLLEDDDRAFYRLAVQQAEAMYHIKANHPLFLYFTQDPMGEMKSWKQEAFKFFYIGMLLHFCWQLLCVVLATAGFRKLGHY